MLPLEWIDNHPLVSTSIALVLLALAAYAANLVIKLVLLRVLHRLLKFTPYGKDPELSRQNVIERLSQTAPPLIIALGIAVVPNLHDVAVVAIRNVANATIILMLARAISAVLNVVDVIYHRRPKARLRPMKSYIQVLKIAVYVIATVMMIATLMDQSPIILLSGLGAMAAVLILVFQDTLLSLVAGIQISSTDMVRVGDWIEVPNQDANGDVLAIELHTVKVQNFDKTITTIPIRRLVTDPFKNYRGMQESGGRRIKRAINIDQSSIRFMTQDELDRLASIGLLENYLKKKREEIAQWNASLGDKASVPANTRRSTNIGIFRAYAEAYLRNHPYIHPSMVIMVRQMEPTPTGLPMEFYAFTNTVVWVNYEAIQSDIFDHLYAILAEFDLRVFQAPAGHDMQQMSVMLAQANRTSQAE
jgi:miniconductance mechanosensitive channel